jgi:THO complex subunit 2
MKPILGHLIEKKIISYEDCHLLLESDLMTRCNLTRIPGEGFGKMISQVKTQKHFTQVKFNLLREENEGFSKLIVELSQLNISGTNVKVVIQNIQKLIGFFSLDPSRIIDLILTAFENNSSNLSYIDILNEFGNKWSITQILGSKI